MASRAQFRARLMDSYWRKEPCSKARVGTRAWEGSCGCSAPFTAAFFRPSSLTAPPPPISTASAEVPARSAPETPGACMTPGMYTILQPQQMRRVE